MRTAKRFVKLAGCLFILTCCAASASAAGPTANDQSVLMRAEDGETYIVQPGETLSEAMQREGARVMALPAQQEEEESHCVPEPLEKKPEGSVSCKCYEVTECKGNESRECKRHCKKDLCMCCTI